MHYELFVEKLSGIPDSNVLIERFLLSDEVHCIEFHQMAGTPQNPVWHPEGDVLTHSILAYLQSRKITTDSTLHMATLFHDIGKLDTTVWSEEKQKWIAHGHDFSGAYKLGFGNILKKTIKTPKNVRDKIASLVQLHMRPYELYDKAGPKGFKKLETRLREEELSVEELAIVSAADKAGRSFDAETPNFHMKFVNQYELMIK